MSFNINTTPSQKGRIAVVTGANIGLGYETALALAAKEMEVVLACRNMQKAEAAKSNILKQHPNATINCIQLDLRKLSSVRAFAKAYAKQYNQLDVLINNAGIMMPPFSLTEDGSESQLGVNYISHFLLTYLLFPILKKTANSRIVSLASIAHKNGNINFDDLHSQKEYSKMGAYAQSKLACLMFAYELQRRLDKAGHTTLSVAAHPGVSNTNLGQHFPKIVQSVMPYLLFFMLQPPKNAAEPTLYAALGKDINGGDYTGPNGWKEYKGKAVKVGSTRRSKNEELLTKLWEVTEDILNIKFL